MGLDLPQPSAPPPRAAERNTPGLGPAHGPSAMASSSQPCSEGRGCLNPCTEEGPSHPSTTEAPRDFLPVLRAGGPTSRHCRGFSSGLTGGRLPLCVLTWPLAGSALSARDTGPLRPGPHPHGLVQPNQPRSPLSTRSPPGVRSELPHVSVEGTQFRPEQGEAPRGRPRPLRLWALSDSHSHTGWMHSFPGPGIA